MGKKSGGRVRVKQMGGPKMPTNPLADLAIAPEEMIHLPPKPDSNSGFLIWPMSETFSMTYKNYSAVYPNYIDSNKTVKLGRRIAAKDALPEPTIQDIHEALISMDIRHVIQPHKGYSRDASSRWDNPGRVLVDLEGAVETGVLEMSSTGGFDMDDIPEMGDAGDDNVNKENTKGEGKGKKLLLRQLAQTIQGLPNRQKRLEEKNKLLEEEKEKAAKAEKEATKTKTKAGGGSGGGGGNRKKKGKKKK